MRYVPPSPFNALSRHITTIPAKAGRIVFRIGVNLGDVVIDGEDIQGDGVNLAARLEGLAEPGSVCVSAGVYDQVRDRTDLIFQDLGERHVKNIDRPIRVCNGRPAISRRPGASRRPGRRYLTSRRWRFFPSTT